MAFYKETETTTVIDEVGKEITTTIEKNSKFIKNDEPDYIKLYTNIWAEFNGIPQGYRGLFLQLATRMTYSDASDLNGSQLVNTGKPYSSAIMKALGWKEDMLKTGLRKLVGVGAIKRVARGVYQINPTYAGKGEWKYNPKLERGGVEDLVAVFNFKDKTVDTQIVWADNGKSNDFNDQYREGLGVKASDEAVLKTTVAKPIQPREPVAEPPMDGQVHTDDLPEIFSDMDTVDEQPPIYPKTEEECKSHEDCLKYTKYVLKREKGGSAYYLAERLGLPTISKNQAERFWDNLPQIAV